MSLVERALKKLQDSRGTLPLPSGTSAPLPRVAVARVLTADTVQSGTGVASPAGPPRRIVSIDHGALRAMGLVPPADVERVIATQYQQIKRPLIASALGMSETAITNGNRIMLASALPGEGKTFTTLNLALSMARERDLQVVLVDADVAKPHISHLLEVSEEKGLLDLLSDSTLSVDEVLLPTNIPSLSVLPSGHPRENATELLASQRMEDLAVQLERSPRPRLVLFDSPPLLLSAESRALVNVAGQIVLVVRADVTPQKAVLEAIAAVGGRKPMRLVLNQSEAAPVSDYYGYGIYPDQAAVPASTDPINKQDN